MPLARGAARARSPRRVGLVPLGQEARPAASQMGAGHQEQGCEATLLQRAVAREADPAEEATAPPIAPPPRCAAFAALLSEHYRRK